MRRRRPERVVVSSILGGAVIGACVGMVLALAGAPFILQFPTQIIASIVAMIWLVYRSDKKRFLNMPTTITPSQVGMADPLHRHVIAQAYNTGKPMVGWYDDEGKMHYRETEPIRVPITRIDADGTTTDGTAEVSLTMLDTNDPSTIAPAMRDFRDLDGTPLVLPPKSRFEVNINTGDFLR